MEKLRTLKERNIGREIDMKRIACLLLAVMLVLGCIPTIGEATEREQKVIRFEDGSYAITEIITSGMRASGKVSGSKPYTYYSSDGVAQWKAVVSGSFTYTGNSATCTSASCSVTAYNSEWYTISKSASKSGSTATGNFSIGRKLLGVLVETKDVTLKLSCDKNGNLS